MTANVIVRRATPADGEVVVALIEGLANYEKLTPPGSAFALSIFSCSVYAA